MPFSFIFADIRIGKKSETTNRKINRYLFLFKVEATDDDCQNADHRVCGYEILTPDVPFTIDRTGSISITKTLTNDVYVFDVVARDCFPSTDKSKEVSQPARVTFKLIRSCSPSLTGKIVI